MSVTTTADTAHRINPAPTALRLVLEKRDQSSDGFLDRHDRSAFFRTPMRRQKVARWVVRIQLFGKPKHRFTVCTGMCLGPGHERRRKGGHATHFELDRFFLQRRDRLLGADHVAVRKLSLDLVPAVEQIRVRGNRSHHGNEHEGKKSTRHRSLSLQEESPQLVQHA